MRTNLISWWYNAHVRAKRVGMTTPDTCEWRNLAAAVVHMALDDAVRGNPIYATTAAARERLTAEAQGWLLSETGAALLALLDLNHAAVLDALTRPTAKEGSL